MQKKVEFLVCISQYLWPSKYKPPINWARELSEFR